MLSVDVPSVRDSLNADPDAMIDSAAKPVLIDEWQVAPAALGAVKRAVEHGAAPGTFLLTGSADPQSGLHAAAGRVVRLPMHPLTQLEIESSGEADLADRTGSLALSRILSGARPLPAFTTDVSKADVIDRIMATGFPAVVRTAADDRFRADWVNSYLASVLALDPDAARIDGRRLRRYLDAVRATSGTVVTDQSLREAADVATNTARGYQDVLERTHVVASVPAWGGGALSQLLKAPKRFVVDAALVGASRELLTDDPTRLGPILETFVHSQLAPLGACGPQPFELYHLRTAGGQREIDFILQTQSGGVVAVEVKATVGVGVGDARHVIWLREALGDQFVGGIVLHLGQRASLLSDRVWAMPVAALWQPWE